MGLLGPGLALICSLATLLVVIWASRRAEEITTESLYGPCVEPRNDMACSVFNSFFIDELIYAARRMKEQGAHERLTVLLACSYWDGRAYTVARALELKVVRFCK